MSEEREAYSTVQHLTSLERIFRYFENSLMQVVLGIFGGLSGLFLDGRWYVFLTPLAVAALHRGKVLEGLSRKIQIIIYILVTCVIATTLFCCGIKMNGARDKEYAALIQVIRAIPSTSVSTEEWFWPSKPSASQQRVITSTQPAVEQDELLTNANRELGNCKDYIANLPNREKGWSDGAIAEDKMNLEQFNNLERLEPSPNEPRGHADAVRKRLQKQIDQEESVFSSQEMQNWNETYSQEFQPVYWEMVERVANGNDLKDSNAMGKPKELGLLEYQCSHLQELIQEYKSRSVGADTPK